MLKIISLKSCIVIFFLLLISCATRPVLYPNNKFKSVGKDKSEQDIDKCINDADKFLKSNKGKRILKSGGKGALLGGIMGAALGLFTGDIGTGAAMGATAGGVGGAAGEALSPDQVKRRYVNYCLSKKQYKVIGWD